MVVDIDHVEPIKKYYSKLGHRVAVVMLDIDEETREQRARDRQGDTFSLDEWIRRNIDETMCYTPDKIAKIVDVRMVRNDDGMIEALMKLGFGE